MLPHLFILLIFCCVSKQSGVTDKKEYLLKLTPEQVRQAFNNVMTEDYIKELAKEFATRAAVHFVKEIKNQKKVLLSQMKLKRSSRSEYINPAQVKKIKGPNMVNAAKQQESQANSETKEDNESTKIELDDREALKLLEEPAPDGDHLDSSGELTDDEKNKIPVIQLTKINGIYYRRLLGMI